MNKRKVQDPEAIKLAETFLASFTGLIPFNDLKSLLLFDEIPFDDQYRLSFLLAKMNKVLSAVISSGNTTVERQTDKWVIEKLTSLKNRLLDNTCHRYREYRAYQLSGAYTRWSTSALIFHVCSSIWVILNHLLGNYVLPPLEDDKLADMFVIMYPNKRISDYSQIELRTALRCLSLKWNSLHYSPCLQIFIDYLNLRAAILCVGMYTSAVLDGKEGTDKFKATTNKSHNPNDRLILSSFSCSPDYISDISSMILTMRCSLYFRTLSTSQIVELGVRDRMESYDPSILEKGFLLWLKDEVATLEGATFKTDLRSAILHFCALKPGDYEKYMRDNSGRTATDPAVVIEHCSTPLQAVWWTSASLRGGIPKLIEDPNPEIRSITILKAFHHSCKTKSQFDWWLNCFVTERDIVQKQDKMKKQEAPMVLKQMGEYNLWFNGTIYRTRTVIRALILWTVTMVVHLKCKFVDANFAKQKLTCLSDFLRIWNGGKLVGEQDAQMREADASFNDGVFCEVEDPMFVDKV